MKAVELKNVGKIYHLKDLDIPVLHNVNLEIMQGEFVAIMGQSGSGKSTLLNIIGLLDKPSKGYYRLAGVEVSACSDIELSVIRNQYLGFIFQQFNLLPKLTIQENVSLPTIYSILKHKESHENPLKLLDMVGLSDRLIHKSNEISGGQQQRVAIARSLINKPSIILADEPTGNLDTKSARDIIRILKDLNGKGITVIMVTHEPEIAACATRNVKMQDGSIVYDKTRIPVKYKLSGKMDRKQFKYKMFSFLRVKSYFIEAVRTIVYNKTRSILSTLGVMMGVVSLISMLAIGSGAKKAVEEAISHLGSNTLVVIPGATNKGGIYYKERKTVSLKGEDIDDIKKNVSGIKNISGCIYDYSQVVANGKNYNTIVEGVSADYADLKDSYPSNGRFFTESEDKEKKKLALLGQTVVKKIYGSKNFNPIGTYLKINGVDFQVIGILPSRGSESWKDEDDKVIIPLNTAMYKLFGIKDLYFITVQIKDGIDMDKVSNVIIKRLLFIHRIPFYQKDFIEVKNMVKIRKTVLSSNRVFSFLIGSITFISLLVGGVGIMNIMFASVSERTKEIGLRKALGANKTDILLQFIVESTFICCIGGLIGIIIGWGGTIVIINKLCKKFFHFEACVTYFSVVLAFCFSGFIGLFFAVWPARKASLLNPIDALRNE